MITEKEIKKFIDDLKKKLESMVHGKVVINETDFRPSIMVNIYSYKTINSLGFGYVISWFELERSYNYLGSDTYIDLISKRIVDEYKNSILKLFIKDENQ